MALPGQSFTIRNDGTGAAEISERVPLYMGCAEKGTVDTVFTFTRPSDVVTTFGQGPLSEDLCYHLANVGGPVRGMRLTGGTAGATGSVTPVRVGSSTGTISSAGAPYDDYDIIVEITTTGTTGAGEFKYTLDGGKTYSDVLLIPSGGTYAVPSTNMTWTFTPGAGPTFFEKGDKFTFTATAPHFTTTNLGTGVTALINASDKFRAICLSGMPAAASDAATIFSAMATHAASLEAVFKFTRVMLDAGSRDTAANVKTSFAAVANDRLNATYDRARVLSAKPIQGRANPLRSARCAIMARTFDIALSADAKRIDVGQLPGVSEPVHDERTATTSLDGDRITTLRTWYGDTPGIYVTQCRIKSQTTSDFRLWPHGIVMDVACEAVYERQKTFPGRNPRQNFDPKIPAGTAGAPGTIYAPDAIGMEREVRNVLDAVLLQPTNQDNTKGHVSARAYNIDRTTNIQQTKAIVSELKLVPLLYIDEVQTTLSYAFAI